MGRITIIAGKTLREFGFITFRPKKKKKNKRDENNYSLPWEQIPDVISSFQIKVGEYEQGLRMRSGSDRSDCSCQ